MRKMRKVFYYLNFGIIWGGFFFLLYLLTVDIFNLTLLKESVFNKLTANIVGYVFVGIGCASISFVYEIKKLPFWSKILIHFLSATLSFFIANYFVKWIPLLSTKAIVGQIIVRTLLFFIIWALFFLYHKWDAKKINDQLKKLQS